MTPDERVLRAAMEAWPKSISAGDHASDAKGLQAMEQACRKLRRQGLLSEAGVFTAPTWLKSKKFLQGWTLTPKGQALLPRSRTTETT